MFFPCRATQAEYFDSPDRAHSDLVEGYASLADVNRLFRFAQPFQDVLPGFVGREHCPSLSILDLGAGDGQLGNHLAGWARKKHGWHWRFTHLDLNLSALRLNPGASNVAASALALPFHDASFDLVIASQMTHHFSDAQVVQHLREAWRVSRRGIYVADLHRSLLLYGVLKALFAVRRFPAHFEADGLLSVKRGFRPGELQSLARQAGISAARAWLYCGTRVILQARKAGPLK